MNILITGAKGQLGNDLSEILKKNHYNVFSFSSKKLDITNLKDFIKIADNISPNVIINCAAYTKVDDCETNINKAFFVNSIGAKNCAIVANIFNAKLFHISTDYIFDGKKGKSYTEFDLPNPESIYGKSKYYAEQLIKEHCNRFFILRVAGVYGINGENFVKTIVRLGQEKNSLKIVDDQITTPTYTVDISNQILKLIDTDLFGIYHATCEGQCSWYEFTISIFNKLNINIELIPCSVREFTRPAKRPLNSVLENFNLKLQQLNVMRHWQDSLSDFLNKHKKLF